MQDDALGHAQQVDPLLAIVLAVIEPLDGKAIAERFDRILKGDTVVALVRGGIRIVPFERLILDMY
jgi:hypothetical protein